MTTPSSDVEGIRLHGGDAAARGRALDKLSAWLESLGLHGRFAVDGQAMGLRGIDAADADTLGLCARRGLDPARDPADAEREILLAMLASPVGFTFRSDAEVASAVRVRRNIAAAARLTAMDFDTTRAAERPADSWTYDEARGFTVRPGHALIDALRAATQPGVSGRAYAFSCYRATEYVILLGLAEELQTCNPPLLARLQRQWETRAVMSRRFHETFLHEYGSLEAPLPPRYYVPGDRVWFRNPDDPSSDAEGYEGSWVIYLGGGLFSNFWKRDRPYTLTGKCVEIYHWRDGLYRDGPDGEARIDEVVVDTLTQATLADPEATATVLARMLRIRDPQGVYASGGCIDASREYPRCICPSGSEVELPDA